MRDKNASNQSGGWFEEPLVLDADAMIRDGTLSECLAALGELHERGLI